MINDPEQLKLLTLDQVHMCFLEQLNKFIRRWPTSGLEFVTSHNPISGISSFRIRGGLESPSVLTAFIGRTEVDTVEGPLKDKAPRVNFSFVSIGNLTDEQIPKLLWCIEQILEGVGVTTYRRMAEVISAAMEKKLPPSGDLYVPVTSLALDMSERPSAFNGYVLVPPGSSAHDWLRMEFLACYRLMVFMEQQGFLE